MISATRYARASHIKQILSDGIARFTSNEFIEKNKESKDWIKIPERVRQRFLASGHAEDKKRLSQFEAWAEKIRATLSDDDLTDAERKDFLHRFFALDDTDLDAQDSATSVGRILAALTAADDDAVGALLCDGEGISFVTGFLDLEEMRELNETFESEFKKWRDANGIQRPKDRAAIERLNKRFGLMRATLSDMAGMSVRELVERLRQRE